MDRADMTAPMPETMSPREKVARAIKDTIRDDASIGLQMTMTPRFVNAATDRILAALASSGDQIPGPDDVTAPSSMGCASATGEAAREKPPHSSGDHAEMARLKAAMSKSNDEICQSLGKALGYPWFKDDQVNFPGATAENGVCVGDHVAESLADEAARRITEAERKLAEAVAVISDIAETPYSGVDWPRSRAATYLASKEAERG